MTVTYTKGSFAEYRAIHDIRIKFGERDATIWKDSVIEYDGYVVKWEGETHHAMSLRNAIKVGWFVDPSDTESVYVPQRALTQLRPATNLQEGENKIDISTTSNEERVIMSYKEDDKSFRKNMEIKVESQDSEGVVVAKVPTPPKEFVVDGSTDQNVPYVKREIIVPKSQVMGRAGDELAEVFPEAASSGDHYPKPAVKKASEEASEAPSLAEKKKAERYAQLGETLVEESVEESKMVRTSVGIDWDLAPHWVKRAQYAIERYGSSSQILESIMEVEKPGVRSKIQEFLLELEKNLEEDPEEVPLSEEEQMIEELLS